MCLEISVFQCKLNDLDNPVSQKLRDAINSIRGERCRYMKVSSTFFCCSEFCSFGRDKFLYRIEMYNRTVFLITVNNCATERQARALV